MYFKEYLHFFFILLIEIFNGKFAMLSGRFHLVEKQILMLSVECQQQLCQRICDASNVLRTSVSVRLYSGCGQRCSERSASSACTASGATTVSTRGIESKPTDPASAILDSIRVTLSGRMVNALLKLNDNSLMKSPYCGTTNSLAWPEARQNRLGAWLVALGGASRLSFAKRICYWYWFTIMTWYGTVPQCANQGP